MDLNSKKATCNELDRKTVIMRELRTGLHLLTQLRLLIEDRSERARELCQEVGKAVEASLSFVNSMDNLETSQEPMMVSQLDSLSSDKGLKRSAGSEDLNPNQSRRKVRWETIVVTPYPFNDGYQWRKYGQKDILNFSHPRCYYRCTYDNCNARKQVQQKNSNNPPLYEVILKNAHTCNSTRQPFPEVILPFSSEGTHMISFGPNASSMKFKGEDFGPLSNGNSTSSANNAKSCQTSEDNRNIGINLASPPSPPGQFYGSDASAYNDPEMEFFYRFSV